MAGRPQSVLRHMPVASASSSMSSSDSEKGAASTSGREDYFVGDSDRDSDSGSDSDSDSTDIFCGGIRSNPGFRTNLVRFCCLYDSHDL